MIQENPETMAPPAEPSSQKDSSQAVSTGATPTESPGAENLTPSKRKRTRRTAAEIERKYFCVIPGCGRSYGSKGALTQHQSLKHDNAESPHKEAATLLHTPTSEGERKKRKIDLDEITNEDSSSSGSSSDESEDLLLDYDKASDSQTQEETKESETESQPASGERPRMKLAARKSTGTHLRNTEEWEELVAQIIHDAGKPLKKRVIVQRVSTVTGIAWPAVHVERALSNISKFFRNNRKKYDLLIKYSTSASKKGRLIKKPQPWEPVTESKRKRNHSGRKIGGPTKEGFTEMPANWPSHVEFLPVTYGIDDIPLAQKQSMISASKHFMDDLEIKKIEDPSHPACGQYGLFALKKFAKFSLLGEYTGHTQVFSQSEAKGNGYLSILFEDGASSIDVNAQKGGNALRFINDYRQTTQGKPNVSLQTVPIEGRWHILAVVTKDIEIGEEILADYGTTYWTESEGEEKQKDKSEATVAKPKQNSSQKTGFINPALTTEEQLPKGDLQRPPGSKSFPPKIVEDYLTEMDLQHSSNLPGSN